MLPFGVTIFSFFTHTGEKKHKEKPWETTVGWEGTPTFLIAMIRSASRPKAPPMLGGELSAKLTEGGSLSRMGEAERAYDMLYFLSF